MTEADIRRELPHSTADDGVHYIEQMAAGLARVLMKEGGVVEDGPLLEGVTARMTRGQIDSAAIETTRSPSAGTSETPQSAHTWPRSLSTGTK